jgi:hypothetical protein
MIEIEKHEAKIKGLVESCKLITNYFKKILKDVGFVFLMTLNKGIYVWEYY